jgi:hypothetical protein
VDKIRPKILRVPFTLLYKPKVIIFVEKLEAVLGLGRLKTCIIQHNYKTLRPILRGEIRLRQAISRFIDDSWLDLLEIRETLCVRA